VKRLISGGAGAITKGSGSSPAAAPMGCEMGGACCGQGDGCCGDKACDN